ncbi:MAG: TIM44-like domain-containing protein [Bacteroidales bacterium]|nr:TIM44-like domain-containing protein [Bacteroidales bacterium]
MKAKLPSGLFLLLTFVLCSISIAGYATAGGASHSGGDGGDAGALIEILFYIFWLIPSPYNFIVAAVVIVLFLLVSKHIRKTQKARSIFNSLPTGRPVDQIPGYDRLLMNNPDFNLEKFKEKVKTAFMDINKGWEAQDLSKPRKYVSDGVYQRFNTQMKMMGLLGQKNTFDHLEVKDIFIDKVDTDGNFDVVHVAFHAAVKEKYVSEKYPNLTHSENVEFVEFWSFIKKRGAVEKDMFSNDNCPNCGAELTNLGELSKCQYCGALTNSGEFDWVLAEITQPDDYINSNPKVFKSANLEEKVFELFKDSDDFSIQLIEDKVSNGYLQIETARVFKKPEMMRRFVSNELFDKLSESFGKDQEFIYNRIFLNDVTLIGAAKQKNKHLLSVAVKCSYQRVTPGEKKANYLDEVIISKTDVVLVERDVNAGVNKGSIYSHSCPSCGGPTGDTIDLKCQFCGAELNSTSNEWIIRDVMDSSEYMKFYSENSSSFVAQVDPGKLDSMYKVRDYAFNNLLILVAADGQFDSAELEYTERMAKKWGYDLKKIQPMFQMAQAGQLVIRMPEEMKDREKIYKMMVKAAEADGNIAEEEQKVLDSIKQRYLDQQDVA